MLDLHDQLRAYGSLVDEAVAPVGIVETARRATEPHLPAPRRLHPVLVAAAAAAIVLLVIGGFALMLGRSDRPIVTTLPSAPTTAPATTEPATSTTTPQTTTQATTAQVPAVTWTRVDTSALAAPGSQTPWALIVIDQNIVLVGGETEIEGTPSVGGGWGPTDAAVWRSEDGLTWQQVSTPEVFGGPGTQVVADFAVRGDTIVAVGSETEGSASTEYDSTPGETTAAVWLSQDAGLTWTRVTGNDDAFADRWMHAVIATPDGFLAVGTGVWASPDGLEWTLVQDVPELVDVTAFEGGYVAIGDRICWGSEDGTTWSSLEGTYGLHDGVFNQIAVVPDGLIVVGTYQEHISWGQSIDVAPPAHGGALMSSNGTGWHEVMDYTNGHLVEVYGVAVTGDFLVAVGQESSENWFYSSGFAWESTDGGNTWLPVGNPDDVFGDYRRDMSGLRLIGTYHDGYIAIGHADHWGTSIKNVVTFRDEDLAVWIGSLGK
jgi:hypothetical protein